MQTVGFVGVGKIGLPISENLIKSGFRVLGYRRGSLADFEKIGGVRGKVAGRHRRADRHRAVLPALHRGDGRGRSTARKVCMQSARPGQIIVELGSHPVPDKEKHVAPLAAKGAAFIDGEVSGTPGMVAARKAVIYLGGDAEACQEGRARHQGLRRHVPLLRAVRRREQGQAGQQPPGRDPHRRGGRGDGARPEGRRRRRHDDQGDRRRAAAARPSSASARPGWRSAGSCPCRARRRSSFITST